MGFTDDCDIFASFHQDGFNRIISHVRSQRPSLFNYATAAVSKNRELLCTAINAHPIVAIRNNPLMTIVDPLPVPGTNYGLNFAAQLVDLQIDFHPSDRFQLPPELNPPLSMQRLGIKLTLCGGIGCPPTEVVNGLIPPPEDSIAPIPPRSDNPDLPKKSAPIIPLQTRRLNCFCLDAYATGGMRIVTYNGKPFMEPFLDGFEIVEIRPVEIENNLECFISLMLKLAVLPGLRILLKHAPLNLTQGATDLLPQPTNAILSPMPVSPALPHNPAIEQDRLKVFLKAEVI